MPLAYFLSKGWIMDSNSLNQRKARWALGSPCIGFMGDGDAQRKLHIRTEYISFCCDFSDVSDFSGCES